MVHRLAPAGQRVIEKPILWNQRQGFIFWEMLGDQRQLRPPGLILNQVLELHVEQFEPAKDLIPADRPFVSPELELILGCLIRRAGLLQISLKPHER
jgi:hypothetical protein